MACLGAHLSGSGRLSTERLSSDLLHLAMGLDDTGGRAAKHVRVSHAVLRNSSDVWRASNVGHTGVDWYASAESDADIGRDARVGLDASTGWSASVVRDASVGWDTVVGWEAGVGWEASIVRNANVGRNTTGVD